MKKENKLLLILSFNILLMLLEVAGGLLSHSLALLSDAGHMLTDSLAIFLSYLAINWSKKPATARRTYGYHRTEILVALVNGLTLLGVSAYIFYEAILRFVTPAKIDTGILLIVAAAGLVGNLIGMLLLRQESHESLNIRGAFFHLLGDTLSSLGVIAGGLVILFTGWNFVDSLIGILLGGIVLRGAIDLISESAEVLLEAVPRDIDIGTLKQEIDAIPGVRDFHEIHIWTITSGRRALSGHIRTDNITTRESQRILCAVRGVLAARFNITHATLEVECDACSDNICEFSDTAAAPRPAGGHHHS
jgi:cobalt-zinc-cadmium efflux system protein